MSFEVIHFRDADKILRQKRMKKEVQQTLECIDQDLSERFNRGTLLRITLDQMGWRENESLTIFEGRRYSYKGFRKGIAIEANLSNYEGILDGLFKLQVGYDKGNVEAGILLLNGFRSGKSPLGSNADLVRKEVAELEPTISLPVTIVLFDFGTPKCIDPDGEEQATAPAVEDGSDEANGNLQDEEVNVNE